jgi:hypothetical protein
MTARLRTIGIGGSIAALLASAALMFPAAEPAQAMTPRCEMLRSMIDLAIPNEIWYAIELMMEYKALGC